MSSGNLIFLFFETSFFSTTSFWFNFTVLMNYLCIAFTSSTSLLVLACFHFLSLSCSMSSGNESSTRTLFVLTIFIWDIVSREVLPPLTFNRLSSFANSVHSLTLSVDHILMGLHLLLSPRRIPFHEASSPQ